MSEKVVFRAVIEVLGKPKEHVEGAMKEYIGNLKKDERFKILREEFAELKKQESDLWATFSELEIEVKEVKDLISFCFEYMPSILEVLTPDKLTLPVEELSLFFNDLQARLHEVDMVAKQVKLESETAHVGIAKLLRNYLTLLLGQGGRSLEDLSKFTGVQKEQLNTYLDKLISEGRLKKENELYLLKEGEDGKQKEG